MRARVCVWLPLFEEEEWGWAALGFGTRREVALPGFRPTIKNAVKFFSYSSSLSRRRRLFSPSGFFFSSSSTHQTQFVRSRHLPPPWHFHLFLYFFACVISPLSTSLHPVCCSFFFQEKKTTSFFRWITITKYSRYTIFSENRVFLLLLGCVLSKFPFLFRHFTQVIYDTWNRIKKKERDKKTGMSSGQSERSWWMTYSVW